MSACGGAPAANQPSATEPAANQPSATEPAEESPSDNPSEVTLTVWTHDQLYLDYFNSRLADWEALHPDTKFTYDFRNNFV